MRLRAHWYPYHNTLRDLIEQTAKQFGEAILIDFHSMPHEAIETHTRPGVQRPDVVLGDRFGASSSGAIVDAIEAAFRSAGLRVARNAPFAGAFIAQSYGRPSARRHVIQVEIDRGLYMDESKVERGRNFAAFGAVMSRVVTEIAQIGRPSSTALAAE
jgi:N-formylglutamate amidohydrolase